MNSNRRRQVTVMDGSMGRQLCLEGLPQGALFHKIWAASALADPAFHELVVSTLQYKVTNDAAKHVESFGLACCTGCEIMQVHNCSKDSNKTWSVS